MQYRREIDGLRALAVFPVILFHAGFLAGGFVGVDVFFVISGYLITTLILLDLEKDKFSLLNFYERRARRILPALFFVMLVCLPFAYFWVVNPPELKHFSQSLISVVLYTSNFFFRKSTGYFDTAMELKPMLHTWSLAVEEQYYLFIPLLLMFFWKWGKRNLILLFSLLLVLSFMAAQLLVKNYAVSVFFLFPFRAWELLIGSLLAFYLVQKTPEQNIFAEIMSLFGIILIVYGMVKFDKSTPFPSVYALFPTLGTALVIIFAREKSVIGKILGHKILVGIGLISYSAYLWHQPLFAFARLHLFDEPSKLLLSGLILLTFILAFFSWRFVEKPFRDAQKISAKAIFILFLSGTSFFIAIGAIGVFTNGFENRVAAKPFQGFYYNLEKMGFKTCETLGLRFDSPFDYCHAKTNEKINAVVWGDSHAEDKFYGIAKNITAKNWLLLGNPGCPAVLEVVIDIEGKGCIHRNPSGLRHLIADKNISLVVLSFFGNYALTSDVALDHVRSRLGPRHLVMSSPTLKTKDRHELFYHGLANVIAPLLEAKKQVILTLDVPELPFSPLDCVRGRPNCTIPLEALRQRQASQRDMFAQLKANFPQIEIFDPLPLFCNATHCDYSFEGKPLYRDSHHLSLFGSDHYGQAFAAWLKSKNANSR